MSGPPKLLFQPQLVLPIATLALAAVVSRASAEQLTGTVQRLRSALEQCAQGRPEAIIGTVIAAVGHYSESVAQSDDITVLAVRYSG